MKLSLRISLSVLIGLTLSTQPTTAWAESVLQKIERTGILTAGARADAIPFAYEDDNGEYVGYSMELLSLVKDQLETQLDREVTLQIEPITAENRFDRLRSGEIDIECGATTFTWQREMFVDFSIPFFMSGAQLLAPTGSNLASLDSLRGKRIGIIPNTTTQQVISLAPEVTLMPYSDRFAGFEALQQGDIDALASDGVLLAGLRQTASNPNQYELTPSQPYSNELYACMVAEDNSDWRNLVNSALLGYMQRFLQRDPDAIALYNRWWGQYGVVYYPRLVTAVFFAGVVESFTAESLQQVPGN